MSDDDELRDQLAAFKAQIDQLRSWAAVSSVAAIWLAVSVIFV